MALVVRRNPSDQHALPCPFLHMRLQKRFLTLQTGLFLTLQRSIYPSSYSNLPQDIALQKLVGVLGSEGQLLLSEFEDDDSRDTLKLREIFQDNVQQLVTKARAIFIRARVQSQPELEAKIRLLRDLKRKASNFYLEHGGKENKKNIDLALVEAAHIWTYQNHATISAYWHMLNEDPWAGEIHQQLEEKLFKFFDQKAKEIISEVESLQSHHYNTNYGHNLKKSLEKGIKELAKIWADLRKQKKYRPHQITLDYTMLKGRLLYKSMIQRILRVTLEPLICKTTEELKKLAEKKHKESAAKLKMYQQNLHSLTCCIDPEIIKKTMHSLVSPEYILEINKESREDCLRAIEKLQQYTSEEGCLKWARQQWGFDTKELENILKEETPYDRTVVELLALMPPPEEDENTLDDDLSLDLISLKDPVAFFVDRLKKRDEQVLALFVETQIIRI